MTAVNNVPHRNADNRLSPMQREIIAFLRSIGAVRPASERIGHLPRTGQIVAGIGREGDSAALASVSRSLKRLRLMGIVEAYSPSIRTRGMGMHYALAPGV